MKPTIILLLTAILVFQTSLRADEIATNSPADSNAEQIKALIKKVDDAYAAYRQSSHSSNSDELWTHYHELNDTNLPRIFELAKQNPASQTSLDAFGWIVKNVRINLDTLYTNGLQSLEFLRDYHTTNPNIAKICQTLGNQWSPTVQPLMDFLEKAAAENPNRDVRGQANLALAHLTKDKADILADWESDTNSNSEQIEQYKTFFIEGEKSGGSKAALSEAEKLCHIVLDKYADCPTLQPTNAFNFKHTLGELVKIELFELEHLMVGKTAPELEGEDIDGNKLKLSDYRGKIVVLSFWASWCGPCMQMVPSEVKLVKQMEGKPFALIGINGDSNRDDAKRAVEKEKMTWPSFWNKNGSDGVIPNAWNISDWPTVFVLDADGVIQLRFTGYGGIYTENLLSQKVNSLVNQLENRTHL